MVDAGPIDEVDALSGETARAADRGAAERLVFFSDAVVAIAITLLAIDLPVPMGATSGELVAALVANGFDYLSFVISFMVIGAHWRAHHAVFRYLRAVDGLFVHLDFLWLLLIVATPFLTEVIREGDLDVVRFGLYALAQALLLGIFAVMQRVALRDGLFAPGTPRSVTSQVWWREVTAPLAFLVSIPLFLLVGPWAFAVWAAGPNLWGLTARWSGAARSRRGRPPRPSRG